MCRSSECPVYIHPDLCFRSSISVWSGSCDGRTLNRGGQWHPMATHSSRLYGRACPCSSSPQRTTIYSSGHLRRKSLCMWPVISPRYVTNSCCDFSYPLWSHGRIWD
jgi:hypothetical protein